MASKHKTFIIWLVLVIAAATGYIYFKKPANIKLKTALVERSFVEQTVANTRVGTVKACSRSRLSPAIGGQVAKLYVDEGDYVKKGHLLLELWNDDRKAKLQEAKALQQMAHFENQRLCITADADQREFKRLEKLAKRNLASEDVVDHSQSKAKASAAACSTSAAKIDQALAAISIAEASIKQTFLYAPFDGIIAEVTGEIGEFTTPSPPGVATPPAIDILSNDCHYIFAPIDEVDASLLQLGQPVRVSLDAFKGQDFQGTVRRIAAYVEDKEKQARTVNVEVSLSEKTNQSWIAGYSADIEVIIANRTSTLRIPSEALLGDDKSQVFIIEDGLLTMRSIKTGISNWQFTEVLEGLKEGDQVVLPQGRDDLHVGLTVDSSDD